MRPVLAGSLSPIPVSVGTPNFTYKLLELRADSNDGISHYIIIDYSAWELTKIFIQNFTKII